MLNKTIFAQNLTMLCEIYDKSLTKTLQSVYYAVLQDMQDEDFKQAVKRLLQERVFATFPKPAEILSLSNVKKVDVVEIDEIELKAKELIELVQSMNGTIYQKHIESGIRFDDLLESVKFPSVDDETIAILNSVKPYCSLKGLIGGINRFQTSKDTLNAFIQAIKQNQRGESLTIENPIERLRIKR